MRRILSCLVLAAALACAAGAEGASLALDPFTKALDPNGCFLTNRPRIVYLGSYCNGAACPPSERVTGCTTSGLDQQVPVGSVMQNPGSMILRTAKLDFTPGSWNGTAVAQLDPVTHRIDVSTSDTGQGFEFYLWYESADMGNPWNQNLVEKGVQALRFSLTGDMSPSRPLWCSVQLRNRQQPGVHEASFLLPVTQSGDVVIPLATYGITQMDALNFAFGDCPWGCSAPGTPRQYSIGAISFDIPNPVPVLGASWGQLKTTYR